MLRIIFFILVLNILIAFGQDEGKPLIEKQEQPETIMVSNFGVVPSGQLRSLYDTFFVELFNNPTAQGYVINYGSKKEISIREKLLHNHIGFREFNASRITFVRGGNKKKFATELWIVPFNAKPPTP
jgi:hypothetical protein